MERLATYLRPRSDFYRHPLKVWPYQWASVGHFVAAYAVLVAVFTLAGLAITTFVDGSALGDRELALNEWLEENRTDRLDTIAHAGSLPSDTVNVVGFLVLFVFVSVLVWRRWHDWAFLMAALALEAAVYVTANYLVGRPRPPVDRLEEIVTESFPSGHMAAAVTLYLGIVVIVS
ncbi:MAG: hypothetical protein AAGK32_04675, partial [Actinomycetota bacterium]